VIIEAENFCDFRRKHTRDVVGKRLRNERVDFVYQFAFPPSHAELLPVGESKRERSAYEDLEFLGEKEAATEFDTSRERAGTEIE
jgi:hypothetical protein